MKAIRKSDGKVIEVTERSSWNGEKIYTADGTFYRKVELDFTVEESEEVTIDGWVARDEDGKIYLHRNKPIRAKSLWYNKLTEYLELPHTYFPSVTWQSDPLEVTITIKPKKQ